jgi:Xaa-Pro aminopeptidase
MTTRLPSVVLATTIFLSAAASAGEATDPAVPDVLDLREQGQIRDEWLGKRLDTVVPMLMRREGIDMWLIIAREYDEDPVIETMLRSTWLRARRRTILMFYDRGPDEPIEKLTVARYAPGTWYEPAWIPEEHGPDQWARLAELIRERDPKQIGINRSSRYALADGLGATQYEEFVEAIGPELAQRLVSAEDLAIGWLETRIPEEMAVYPTIVRMAHAILAEGLSEKVITPGLTTTDDVAWWYRERIRSLGLETWFHPGVSLERADEGEQSTAEEFAGERETNTIRPGDLLHVDFGITYLGLNTDTQHHAYVLRPGETDAPQGLKDGLAANNRVQDILMSHFRTGISGNDLKDAARRDTAAAGLDASIYSHAIGFHGHGAGPWVGMWDEQEARPDKGDYPVQPNTAWSIELNVSVPVPEWGGKPVRFKSEEDAYFDGETIRFLDGRLEELHLIPRQ